MSSEGAVMEGMISGTREEYVSQVVGDHPFEDLYRLADVIQLLLGRQVIQYALGMDWEGGQVTELRVFSTVRGQICFTLVVFFPTRKKPIEVPVQHEGSFFIQFLPIVPRPASETPEKCDHCQFWKEGEVYWVCTHEEAWTGDHICKGYPTRTNCPLKGAEFDAAFRQP